MPEAERTDTVVEGQAYGEAGEQTAFIEATGGTDAPAFFQPQPDAPLAPPEQVAPGMELPPDIFEALARPSAGDGQDLDDILDWVDVLDEASRQPGVSPQLRQFARTMRTRLQASADAEA